MSQRLTTYGSPDSEDFIRRALSQIVHTKRDKSQDVNPKRNLINGRKRLAVSMIAVSPVVTGYRAEEMVPD